MKTPNQTGLTLALLSSFNIRRGQQDSSPAQIACPGRESRVCWKRVCVLLVALLVPLGIHAQSYSIDWHKISGGGGTSTGGVYSVSGTIGQPDAGGPMTGGNYSLTGGFWSLIATVQTTGAPTLYIARSGSSVTIFWQAVPGWSLQQNSDLRATSGWSDSTGIISANGTNSLIIASPPGNLFFRLKSGS